MNILVFKVNKLGDSIVFLPAVQELRRRFADGTITLVTTPNEAELYGGALKPDRLITCAKRAFNKSYRRPWALGGWLWKIRRLRGNACLVPFDQGTVAHILAMASGAETRVGAKLKPARVAGALTEEVAIPADGRAATWNWATARALARALGRGEDWTDAPPPPDLSHLLPRGPRQPAGRRRVVVHSGAGGHLNQWSKGRFATVATALSRDFEVAWISYGATTGSAPPGVIEVHIHSISDLAEWLAGADLFLGNNSGPMHLANALGCSGVVVTGPSAAAWDPYWHRGKWSVLRHPNLPCSPCEKITVQLTECTNIETPMACMAYWTEELVEKECRRRLSVAIK
jgi:ADP-heptose:LPS heptosyltransferase